MNERFCCPLADYFKHNTLTYMFIISNILKRNLFRSLAVNLSSVMLLLRASLFLWFVCGLPTPCLNFPEVMWTMTCDILYGCFLIIKQYISNSIFQIVYPKRVTCLTFSFDLCFNNLIIECLKYEHLVSLGGARAVLRRKHESSHDGGSAKVQSHVALLR